MSKRAYIQNTFEKGMYSDSLPEKQPDGTYNYALNAIHESHEHSGVLVNEESHRKWTTVPGVIVGATHVEERNATVYFSVEGSTSSIYLVSHEEDKNSPQKIMSDTEADCNWGFGACELIYGVFKNMQPCNDLMVYFSSQCEYYVVNIDEMLSPTRRECALAEGCSYFKLFRCICGPNVSAVAMEGGGVLAAGSYQFVAQLEDNDGNTTNWFDVSSPVYIPSENNISGEIGNYSIRVQVDNLEKGYNVLNLAVIRWIKNVPSAQVLTPISYSSKGITYDYYGDNPDITNIQLEEILLKGKKYLRGQDLIQKDGRLFLYGIRQEILPNYQKYANQVQTEWVETEVSAEYQARYHFPSLQRGENYALAIVLKYCDGTYSHAFHIPGRPTSGAVQGSTEDESVIEGGGNSGSIANFPTGGDVKQTLGGLPIEPSTSPFEAAPLTTPYNQDFQTSLDWVNRGDSDWNRQNSQTRGPATGSKGAFFVQANVLDNEAILKGPHFDLTPSGNVFATFDYYTSGEVTDFSLEATVDGTNYHKVWSRPGGGAGEWKTETVALHQLAGSHATLRFKAAGSTTASIAIGDFNLSNAPAPITPIGPGEAQYKNATFNTTSNFERKIRTGTECDIENPNLEQEMKKDIDNIDTQEAEAKAGATNFGNFFSTPELGQSFVDDLDDGSNMAQSVFEQITEYSKDVKCPPLGETNSIKEVAQKLIEEGVIKREEIEVGKSIWTFNKGGRYPGVVKPRPIGPTHGDGNIESITGKGSSIKGDDWTDSWGNPTVENPPEETASGTPEVYESVIPYPDICDCDGNRMYPEGNITHHKMPDNCQSTHYVSNQVGAIHKFDGTNREMDDVFVRPLGLRFKNIYIPHDHELPKPLCKISPFKIVIAKRDMNDRTVIAKGLTTATFTGSVNGREYAFPKHGVNSFEVVDRFIENGDSKIGTNESPRTYNFHSLDTTCQKIPLTSTEFHNYQELFGSGWRHGLYAKGKAPDDWYNDSRIDQRGARQSINLSGQLCSKKEVDITGISYAPANSVPMVGSISLPLMNRYRESSVYMQLDERLPALIKGERGDESDSSFVGDTLDHRAPIKTAAAWYGALYRPLTDQYGTVENMRYIDSGITAGIAHAQPGGSRVAIEGLTGDVFIGPHAFRRTGYVSNKVGNLFPVGNGASDDRQSEWKEDRTVCNHPQNLAAEYLGIDHYATRLPESGDVADAKNWAGLHTIDRVFSQAHASERFAPDSDYYYPKLQKTLITYWGEFEVNAFLRATGKGPQIDTGEVFYPKLKDLYIDSNAPGGHPWEESWLNRFYVRVEQPSISVLTKKAIVRSFIALFLPILTTYFTAINLESIPDSILAMVIVPLMAAVWTYINHGLFTDEWIDKMLGIPRCRTDDEGGEEDNCSSCPSVVQFEDNYTEYHFDFSRRNDVQSFYGIPRTYNTCECDDCVAGQTTQEIYYSEKQVLTSLIDSYRNFKSNNYLFVPAHAGFLRKLLVESNRFYAHTTDGLWILQYNNVALPSNTGNIILGKGDLLRDPQLIMEAVAEGYAGIEDPNAGIHTSAGYYWVDSIGRGIYNLHGGQMTRLSDHGMKNFFKEKLQFCTPSDCRDEKVRGTYYSMGFDHRHNRLLLTKKDGDLCSSWTASYDPLRKIWISFHSYLPMMYVWDRDHLFSVEPGTGNIWIHDDNRTSFQSYFGKSQQPFIIDFVTHQPHGEAWQYYSTILDTEAQLPYEDDYLYERHETFDKIGIWNGTQSTGMIDLIVRSDQPDTENNLYEQSKDHVGAIETVYQHSQWRINELYDFIIDVDAKVLSRPCACSPFLEPRSVDSQRLDQQTQDGRIIQGRYLYHRYVLDSTKSKLYLKSNVTYINEIAE